MTVPGTRVTISSPDYGESDCTISPSYANCLLLYSRWFGFALMNVGELGNFISYAFAPASVVAPLGAVSSINSNVLIVHLICVIVRAHCKLFFRSLDAPGTISQGEYFVHHVL